MSSPDTSKGKRQAVLVLGMHRSGTSALAGVIARLGAALPKTPVRANLNNKREMPLVTSASCDTNTIRGPEWRQ